LLAPAEARISANEYATLKTTPFTLNPLFKPSDIPEDKIFYGLANLNTEYLLFKETIMDALPPSLRLEQDFTEFNIYHLSANFI